MEEIKPTLLLPFNNNLGDDFFKISIQEITQLSNPKAYLYQLLKAYHFTEFKDVFNLLFAQSGKQVFSRTHFLLKDRDFLILSEIEKKERETIYYIQEKETEITTPVHLNLTTSFEGFVKNKNTIYVSKETVTFPLIVRKWKHGDSFYPLGMTGKKKLSKYFKDEKLSLIEKEQTWILCNCDDSIIWLIGKRQDLRFEAPQETTNTIKISLL
jgi:tRNA(Ile)-lysidine synthase